MPQFKVIPSREKILAKIPDYAVEIHPLSAKIEIMFEGTVIAATDAALLVKETRHEDVVYLPQASLKTEFFIASEHTTYCPFKGHASYWHISIEGRPEADIVWSYPTPYEEVAQLKDYVSFYTDRTEIRIS